MRRAPGWIVLAGVALELAALALIARAMTMASRRTPSRPHPMPAPLQAVAVPDLLPDFIAEVADNRARYYGASDGTLWIIAGLYSDGRMRMTDRFGRRFAGTVREGHAELVELDKGAACDLHVRFVTDLALHLEMHGGPYDGRTLICEALAT
ncbi:MAG: hypothetical protein ACXWNK_05100 [Vulcanimicrobiaceae bacterium]